jgi:hypothetical protein
VEKSFQIHLYAEVQYLNIARQRSAPGHRQTGASQEALALGHLTQPSSTTTAAGHSACVNHQLIKEKLQNLQRLAELA